MKKTFLLLLAAILAIFPAFAQDSSDKKSEWNFLVEPYLMFPTMKGTVGIGLLPDGELDVSTEDIFGRLKSAFMMYAEANNGKWAITADFVYIKLYQGIEPNNNITGGEVTFEETIFAMEGLYQIQPWLELGIGGRVVTLAGDMSVTRTGIGTGGESTTQQADLTESWVDPVVLFRAQLPDSEKWILEFKADYGGFGLGSDVTYQVQALGGYRFSKLFQATAGYRSLSIDYFSGSGADRFKFDVKTSGPIVRFGFNF